MQGYGYRTSLKGPKSTLLGLKIASVVLGFIAIAFIITVVFLVIAAKSFSETFKDADEVKAVIDQIVVETNTKKNRESYKVYVNYEFEGKSYNHVQLTLVNNPHELQEGQELTVFLNKNNPEMATMSTDLLIFTIFIAVFGGISVLFFIIIMILNHFKRKIKRSIASGYNNPTGNYY